MTTAQKQDVVDLLLAQHNELKSLFAQVQAASGPDKRELFEDLVRLLAVHETAEEQVVHPVARRQAGDGVVDERLREEDEAKKVLAQLYDMGVEHPEFNNRLGALADAVMAHAGNEERDEFPHLRENVPAERLQRMAGAVRAAESIAPTRPHPKSGESATANMLTGPPLAMFDRVRDALRDWRETNQSR